MSTWWGGFQSLRRDYSARKFRSLWGPSEEPDGIQHKSARNRFMSLAWPPSLLQVSGPPIGITNSPVLSLKELTRFTWAAPPGLSDKWMAISSRYYEQFLWFQFRCHYGHNGGLDPGGWPRRENTYRGMMYRMVDQRDCTVKTHRTHCTLSLSSCFADCPPRPLDWSSLFPENGWLLELWWSSSWAGP